MSSESSNLLDQNQIDYKFEIYDFESDVSFKEGLKTILDQSADEQVQKSRSDLIGKAKAFYFSRMIGMPFSWEEYLRRRKASVSSSLGSERVSQERLESLQKVSAARTTIPSEDDATRKEACAELSFDELSDLISSGKIDLIPHNRTIPDIISDADPSQSTAPILKKPWEK
ncbi:hypothetical protein FRC03_002227 [Tulasnella sp. 419]|nr:hypothetical protein FRC02_010384 [Tulasnella sp. 418]KAG8964095.1 hypothetical protein FRC03_002227 [Tulasnella sp. 419]